MATAQSARPTSMSAAVARPAAAPGVQVTAPSRREFLNYIWVASALLALGETAAVLIWFAFPRFKEGEFGGTFAFDPEELPGAGAAPVTVSSGRFHISHTSGWTARFVSGVHASGLFAEMGANQFPL